MTITVILCTYNRCRTLTKALESVAASQLPGSIKWEVLVVDNNSNDQTHEVVGEVCRRFPDRFRYMFEAKPGKSHALNAGIRDARSDVLAFMDDDVIVDALWLNNLTAPLFQGLWVGVGGRVFPQRDFVLPNWISADKQYAVGPLVMFDLGPTQSELTEAPFGTNMAFKRRVFQQYGGFRTDLFRGEDSEFVDRLLNAGERLCYEPSALVYHSIPENRLTKKYFLSWWFDKGRADVRTSGVPADIKWLLSGVPIVWIRRWFMWNIRWMLAFEPSRRFFARVKARWLAGYIAESHSLRHQQDNRCERKCEKAPILPSV